MRSSPQEGQSRRKQGKIIAAAISLIEEHGADCITVRRVCEKADIATGTFYYHFQNKDDLMMHFVRGLSFETVELMAPASDIAGRIAELYMHLIRQYMSLGTFFMRSFYTPDNRALRNYMGEIDGRFAEGTVMARCEQELAMAQVDGCIPQNTDIHQMSADICTMVKGCIFEWCLSEGEMEIEPAVQRMLKAYMA